MMTDLEKEWEEAAVVSVFCHNMCFDKRSWEVWKFSVKLTVTTFLYTELQ